MAKNSPIEWCDHTWPVLNGCRRCSPGCQHCYAEQLVATRLRHTDKYKGLAIYTEGGPRWTGDSRLWIPHLDEPLRIRKPGRIFVANMGDLFFEGNDNRDIAAVFGVMAACPQHTFQVLTKRPGRAAAWLKWIASEAHQDGGPGAPTVCGIYAANYGADVDYLGLPDTWPLPNVWLGVSVENQEYADERIPQLLSLPAALHFISAEPLLGPVNLHPWICEYGSVERPEQEMGPCCEPSGRLGWIIVGGESGNGARPFDMAWARDLGEQCAAASIPFFFKQGGKANACEHDRKGGCVECLPQLNVREFPR